MPTLRGAGVIALAGAAYVAARMVGTYELFLMAYAFAGLAVLALVSVNVPLRRLAFRDLRFPSRLQAKSDLSATLVVANTGLLPVLGLEAFAVLSGPKEVVSAEGRVGPAYLLPGREGRAEMVFSRLPRGVYRLEPVRVRIVDPFGIASRSCVLGSEETVRVVPRIVSLDSFAILAGGAGERGSGRGPVSAGTGEIHTLREYRPGEPLKRIHWKTTARTGELMVMELSEPIQSDVMLVLDGSTAPADVVRSRAFEAGVSALGSVGAYLLEHGRSVGLLHHGERPVSAGFRSGEPARVRLLDALAEVQPDAPKPLATLLTRKEGMLERARAVVVFTSASDRALRGTLTDLRRRGVAVALVHIDPHVEDPHVNSPSGAPAGSDGVATSTEIFLGGLERAGVRTVRVKRGEALGEALEGSSAHDSRVIGRVG